MIEVAHVVHVYMKPILSMFGDIFPCEIIQLYLYCVYSSWRVGTRITGQKYNVLLAMPM